MQELTTNPNRIPLDEAYMSMAEIWALRSKANRLQVGALIVKDQQIISDGYNGMPSGVANDVCEYWHYDPNDEVSAGSSVTPTLRTRPEVLHAESNALLKISKNGGTGAEGGTLYTTYSPCAECAKLIKQAKISRVVYRNVYRLLDGVEMLRRLGVQVDHLPHFDASAPTQPAPPPPPPAVSQSMADRLAQMNTPALMAEVVRAVAPPVPAPPARPVAAPIPVAEVFAMPPAIPPALQVPAEDEVAALLRAHEAQIAATAPQKKGSSLDAPDNGPYKSSFL
jgi:dCMP deaminase